MHDIGTPRCSVRCAHVCFSARLFPCAWRTLLKAGTVEQVYEFCGVRFRGPMSYGLIERGECRVLLHPARLGCGGHGAPSAAFTTNSGTSGQSSSTLSAFFTPLVTAQRAIQLAD